MRYCPSFGTQSFWTVKTRTMSQLRKDLRPDLAPALQGSCDCHVHVFEPEKHPYAADRAYTPPRASWTDLNALLARLRADRVVVVQASVQGDDHRGLVSALRNLGNKARGVAADNIDLSLTPYEDLSAAGVTAMRVNVDKSAWDGDLESLRRRIDRAAARCRDWGWHIELHAPLSLTKMLMRDLVRSDMPIVLDHFAGIAPLREPSAWIDRLVASILRANIYVKLSAPYRIARTASENLALDAFVDRLVSRAPHRLLWGSDWPHTARNPARRCDGIDPFSIIDDVAALKRLRRWAGRVATQQAILVSNPARLYRFQRGTLSAPK